MGIFKNLHLVLDYFDEVILGNISQKPHFDIDITKDDFMKMYPECIDFEEEVENIKDSLIESCIKLLENYNIHLELEKNILLYSSHSSVKKSFHLIIDGYYHIDHFEAKEFYLLVMYKFMEICDVKYSTEKFFKSPIIDSKVYGKTQQFRILGCQKRLSGRPKIFEKEFKYRGQIISHKQERKIKKYTTSTINRIIYITYFFHSFMYTIT